VGGAISSIDRAHEPRSGEGAAAQPIVAEIDRACLPMAVGAVDVDLEAVLGDVVEGLEWKGAHALELGSGQIRNIGLH
jgi:hypothetical protein